MVYYCNNNGMVHNYTRLQCDNSTYHPYHYNLHHNYNFLHNEILLYSRVPVPVPVPFGFSW